MTHEEAREFIRNHFEEFVNRKNVQIGNVNFAEDFVDGGVDRVHLPPLRQRSEVALAECVMKYCLPDQATSVGRETRLGSTDGDFRQLFLLRCLFDRFGSCSLLRRPAFLECRDDRSFSRRAQLAFGFHRFRGRSVRFSFLCGPSLSLGCSDRLPSCSAHLSSCTVRRLRWCRRSRKQAAQFGNLLIQSALLLFKANNGSVDDFDS
jgi:hypothetical protein